VYVRVRALARAEEILAIFGFRCRVVAARNDCKRPIRRERKTSMWCYIFMHTIVSRAPSYTGAISSFASRVIRYADAHANHPRWCGTCGIAVIYGKVTTPQMSENLGNASRKPWGTIGGKLALATSRCDIQDGTIRSFPFFSRKLMLYLKVWCVNKPSRDPENQTDNQTGYQNRSQIIWHWELHGMLQRCRVIFFLESIFPLLTAQIIS